MKTDIKKSVPSGPSEDQISQAITQITITFTDEDNLVAMLESAAKTLKQITSELRGMKYEINSYLSDEEDGDHKEMSFSIVREPTAKERKHAVKEWNRSKEEQKQGEEAYKQKMIRWGYFNKDGSLKE